VGYDKLLFQEHYDWIVDKVWRKETWHLVGIINFRILGRLSMVWHLFCKSKVNKNGQGRERVILKLKTDLKCVKRMRWHPIFCQLYEQHLSLKILYVPCSQITVILRR